MTRRGPTQTLNINPANRWVWQLLQVGVVLALSFGSALAKQSGVQRASFDPTLDVSPVLGLLPRTLVADDIAGYARIFDLQGHGRWQEADRAIARITNPLLMGQVRAQRLLHPTDYRSSYTELRDWLQTYPDLPQAQRIYRLALKRQPADAEPPAKPVAGYLGGSGQELARSKRPSDPAASNRIPEISEAVQKWLNKIRTLVSRDRPTEASRLLTFKIARFATAIEFDTARWIVARGYIANRRDIAALRFAVPAARRSGTAKPGMYWTAGLAAWRAGSFTIAAEHFSALATSDAPGAEVAAGAFWAARAYLVLRRPDLHERALRVAAGASDQFYSLLAKTVLGEPVEFDFDETGLQADILGLLYTHPGSKRAIALAQVGRPDLAEKELRKLAARARPQLATALAALAERLRLPATQMRIAQRLRLLDGRRHDGAMYPLPPWAPEDGYTLDRALLFALIRAESGFDPKAKSAAGAIGLMQILPDTAHAMAKRYGFNYPGADSLYDPVVNLTAGQGYVRRLLQIPLIGRDLIKMSIAYNAGLKRLEDWVPKLRALESDPILYIESIPIAETRAHIRKVMGNIWAYRARMGQAIPSLKRLAEGLTAVYGPLDTPGVDFAAAN